jgi:hypothetical protein
MWMPVNSIIAAIDSEIDTFQKARLLLSRIDGAGKDAAATARKVRKRWNLSAQARTVTANAQHKRRAAAKKTVKVTPVKAAKDAVYENRLRNSEGCLPFACGQFYTEFACRTHPEHALYESDAYFGNSKNAIARARQFYPCWNTKGNGLQLSGQPTLVLESAINL